MHVRVYVSFAFSFLSSLLPTRALVTLTCQHHPSFSNNFPLFSLSPAPPNPPIKSPTLVCAAASEALDLHSQQSPPVSPQTSAQCKASPEAAAAILCLVNPLLTYEAAADVVASNGTNINPERREIGKEEEKEEGGEDIAGVSPPPLDANARELLADIKKIGKTFRPPLGIAEHWQHRSSLYVISTNTLRSSELASQERQRQLRQAPCTWRCSVHEQIACGFARRTSGTAAKGSPNRHTGRTECRF